MEDIFAGVVLAGGQSRRFGSPKAFAEKNGIPFYQFSIQSMKEYVESIVLVTNERLKDRFHVENSRIQVITDDRLYAGLGPLAGIYSAMEKVEADWFLIAPVDVPFIQGIVFKHLLQHIRPDIDGVVPIVGGRMQPLISVFRGTMKAQIKAQLKKEELSMKQLFAKCRIFYLEMDDGNYFVNINHREEYTQFIGND